MANWFIYDNQITAVAGFDLSWLPNRAYSYVTPHVGSTESNQSEVRLEAGPYVGTIPLRNGDTLFILPRAGRASYARMLFVAEGLEEAISKEFDRFVNLGHEDAGTAPWVQVLASPFVDGLTLVEREGILISRENTERRLSVIKGKVDPSKSTLSQILREEKPIHARLRLPTTNNLENRLLATASSVLLDVGVLTPRQRLIASRWASSLAYRKPIMPYELEVISSNLKTYRYLGQRSYYLALLAMAKLIVSQGGLLIGEKLEISGEPILSNVNDLFEKYVRRLIFNLLNPKSFIVEKREAGLPSLFLDGTSLLRPDILISKGNEPCLVADVKNKPSAGISAADYYQIFAYLEAFGVDKGLLICMGRGDGLLLKRKMINNRLLFELHLPIEDWNAGERFLAKTMLDLIR
jgi:5-methylcytosine-specific restriction enzyme subunit McrC